MNACLTIGLLTVLQLTFMAYPRPTNGVLPQSPMFLMWLDSVRPTHVQPYVTFLAHFNQGKALQCNIHLTTDPPPPPILTSGHVAKSLFFSSKEHQLAICSTTLKTPSQLARPPYYYYSSGCSSHMVISNFVKVIQFTGSHSFSLEFQEHIRLYISGRQITQTINSLKVAMPHAITQTGAKGRGYLH